MADDIVERLREEGFITHMAKLPRESKILHAASDEIERLRARLRELSKDAGKLRNERDQARAEVVDRALGIKEDVIWDINSPTRKRCEEYARSRGWHHLWDAVNEQERLIREGRTSNEH